MKVSFLEFQAGISKQDRAKISAKNFKVYNCEFKDLEKMLNTDGAFTAFQFLNGERRNENVLYDRYIDFIVLDIDKNDTMDINAMNIHLKKMNLNHILSTTSDCHNKFKYRILLEIFPRKFSSNDQYKEIYKDLEKILGVKIDELPASQIYYSYANSYILSFFGGNKKHIITPQKITHYVSKNDFQVINQNMTEEKVNALIQSLGYELKKDGTYMKFSMSSGDTVPSANAYYNKTRNKVMIKDFSTSGFYGDIIDFLCQTQGFTKTEAIRLCYQFL
ncbi:hypothetical protein [Campylobacter ureolyticus]|uniref:hypothetical protein n=1 Tax=Campylobacter ureolyticus TaxID=827 RepID=UPI00290C2B65|nr:hypothetical protein [Campylobacter ureolyticus]MDU7071341.1 hypothetical protein [Campylobacter ureolyticus]